MGCFSDIMSYYKEAIDGEFNVVEKMAQVHGMSGSEVVGELVKSTRASHERIVRILSAADPTGYLVLCYEQSVAG
jgi:hypothetical protein